MEAGDTLESIAERYGVSPDDIARFALNKLGPEPLLWPGQRLVIPGGGVVYARFSPDGCLGFRVVNAHGNGLSTSCSHLSGIFVEEGQEVARGDVLGQLGSTGNSTGPHVHFEVYRNGAKLNPLDLLPPSADQ